MPFDFHSKNKKRIFSWGDKLLLNGKYKCLFLDYKDDDIAFIIKKDSPSLQMAYVSDLELLKNDEEDDDEE